MTNGEIQMTKQIRIPKFKSKTARCFKHLDFVILS